MSTEKKQEQAREAALNQIAELAGQNIGQINLIVNRLIAQERADAAEEAAREARVDELGQILRAMDDTVHGRLAALTIDTTKGAKE